MTLLELAIKEFQEAKSAVKEFEDANAGLIEHLDTLRRHEAAMESQVREAATKQLKPGASASFLGVPVTYVQARTIDVQKLIAEVPKVYEIPGLIRPSFDSQILNAAVKAGVLDMEAVEACRTVIKASYVKVG